MKMKDFDDNICQVRQRVRRRIFDLVASREKFHPTPRTLSPTQYAVWCLPTYLAKQLPHSGLKSKKCCHVFREATLFASKPNINVGFF